MLGKTDDHNRISCALIQNGSYSLQHRLWERMYFELDGSGTETLAFSAAIDDPKNRIVAILPFGGALREEGDCDLSEGKVKDSLFGNLKRNLTSPCLSQ